MTRKELETVISENVPFSVQLAGGRSYKVAHSDYISLPLLTMTGLPYRTGKIGMMPC